MNNEIIQSTIQELRRGVIIIAVLSQLGEEQYGYSLLKMLADKGLAVEQGTLYPLLRRLESQGLLDSTWKLDEPHPRRYYVISNMGRSTLPQLIEEWHSIVGMMDRLITEQGRQE